MWELGGCPENTTNTAGQSSQNSIIIKTEYENTHSAGHWPL